jgi:hypothetical protein
VRSHFCIHCHQWHLHLNFNECTLFAGPATIRAASKMAEQMTSLATTATQQQKQSADGDNIEAKNNSKAIKDSSAGKSDERSKVGKEKLANKNEGKGKSKGSSEKSAASPPPTKKSRCECLCH